MTDTHGGPCYWAGCNDVLACRTCGIEYAHLSEARPRCGLIARIEAAEARVKRLEEALGDCAEWFKGYGDSHTAKGDIDKAQRNYDRERRARAALEGE